MQVNSKKVGFAYLVVLLIALVVVARIVDLQYFHTPDLTHYKKKDTNSVVIPCTRGSILSDDGRYLAFSIPEYKMAMDCTQASDTLFNNNIDSLAICLANFYQDKKASQYKKDIVERRRAKSHYLLLNKTLLTYQQMKQVSEFPILRNGQFGGGRIVEKIDHRNYPYGRLGFRTLGYIKELDSIPTIGIEGSRDSILRGKDGMMPTRITEGGNWIVDSDRKTIDPIDGTDIQTTLDIDLQDIAQNALMKQLTAHEHLQAGTVVIMDVPTGEIKAMVNLDKTGNGSFDEVYNYAIGYKGEPGSVFKASSLTILLEDKKITLDTEMDGRRNVHWSFKGKPLPDDRYLANYDKLTVRQGFAISSNNVFRIQVANNYGNNPQKYIDRLHDVKILENFPFELNGFAKAGVRSPKDSAIWSTTDLPQIGMGYVAEVTPLHTLNFYNAIANGGVMVRPHLIRNYQKGGNIIKEFPVVKMTTVASPHTIEQVKEAMRGVVTNPRGTAHKYFLDCPIEVAGKTGTARVALGSGGYTARDGSFKHQATFVGFFPYEKPKYSMIVVVYTKLTHTYTYGGPYCAPVFREIVEKVYASSKEWQQTMEKTGTLPEIVDYKSLQCKEDANRGLVPDVVGMGLRDAVSALESLGYEVSFQGKGRVKSQIPAAGEAVTTKKITLTLNVNAENGTE